MEHTIVLNDFPSLSDGEREISNYVDEVKNDTIDLKNVDLNNPSAVSRPSQGISPWESKNIPEENNVLRQVLVDHEEPAKVVTYTPEKQRTFQTETRDDEYRHPAGNDCYEQSKNRRINRNKKIIFCDLLDILIESESASRGNSNEFSPKNNFKQVGVSPRGLYDVRLKLESWAKISAFNPDYVFCITNQPEMTAEQLESWKVLTKYVMYSLADYLRLPHSNCSCLTKIGFDRQNEDVKPGTGLIKKALNLLPENYSYSKRDLVVLGANSGHSNQSDIDSRMAYNARVDYVDIEDLIVSYH